MRVGVVILPDSTWKVQAIRWAAVEQLGFDSAWTYDHLWWRTLADGPWYASIPTLAGAAVATSRLQLGLLVASPNLRHPLALAKDAMTLDDLSMGRFTLGLGAGTTSAGDSNALQRPGDPPLSRAQRTERFAEFVELTDTALRRPRVDFTGHWYTAQEVRMLPGCVQRPRLPLVIAATARHGFDLVARYGQAWSTLGPAAPDGSTTPEQCRDLVARQVADLERACARQNRDPAEIERLFVVTPAAGDPFASPRELLRLARSYAAIGINHIVIHWPRESGVYAGKVTALEAAAQDLEELHEL